VAKPEWGLKRVCPNCGTRYYDMHHEPIVCPKCGVTFDAEAVVKTRRVRAQATTDTLLGPIVVEELDTELAPEIEADIGDTLPIEAEVETTEEEPAEETAEEEETEEQEVIEDASELGEDEDDMAEVIENVDEEEER
jgi:uncharacterized protein (TIGR02300 family)